MLFVGEKKKKSDFGEYNAGYCTNVVQLFNACSLLSLQIPITSIFVSGVEREAFALPPYIAAWQRGMSDYTIFPVWRLPLSFKLESM